VACSVITINTRRPATPLLKTPWDGNHVDLGANRITTWRDAHEKLTSFVQWPRETYRRSSTNPRRLQNSIELAEDAMARFWWYEYEMDLQQTNKNAVPMKMCTIYLSCMFGNAPSKYSPKLRQATLYMPQTSTRVTSVFKGPVTSRPNRKYWRWRFMAYRSLTLPTRQRKQKKMNDYKLSISCPLAVTC